MISSEVLIFENITNASCSGQPYICVEMSGNHMGTLAAALHFVEVAKHSGADILKVQVYRPDTITLNSDLDDFKIPANADWSSYRTLYDLYSKAYTPWDWIPEIFKKARSIGLPIFASPFDSTAVDLLEELDCPAYKIASPEITDLSLIKRCSDTGKPLVFSTGLATENDLDLALSIPKGLGNNYIILKCTSAYPSREEILNLAAIPYLKKKYGVNIGYSDHSIGPYATYAATALGATMIEKHFRLDEDDISIDTSFSMPLSELVNLKSAIQKIYLSIGSPSLDIAPEVSKSLSGRRSLYYSRSVAVGEIATEDCIKSIRPSFGLHPRHLPTILGKRIRVKRKMGERVRLEDFE